MIDSIFERLENKSKVISCWEKYTLDIPGPFFGSKARKVKYFLEFQGMPM